MFTSRAEYRILLRQDNADLRLTEKAHKLGLAKEDRLQKVLSKKDEMVKASKEINEMRATPEIVNDGLALLESSPIVEKTPVINLLRRPNIGMAELKQLDSRIADTLNKYSDEALQQVEINLKYETYIDREQRIAEKIESLEDYRIKPDFDYDRVKALSAEAREKLKRIKPETIGQMSRISGVSPADVSILTVYLGK